MLVEREIGDEPLQPTMFCVPLPQVPQFVHTQVCRLLLPGVECRVTHPELTASAQTGVSASACRMACTTCSSENFDRFIDLLLSPRATEAAIVR